jgi:ligand-binding sensor domain-containing protein/signal transduction histidine kinase
MTPIGLKIPSIILLIVVLLSVGLVWTQPALALDPKKAISQYMHEVWRMEDGLPSNTIAGILQTRDGYLWIGTEGGGLVRFDGVRFTVFNEQNTPAIKGSTVVPNYEDQAGNLWIGTSSGLIRYKDERFTSLTTKDGVPDDLAFLYYIDRAGNLCLVTRRGLSRFQNGAFTTYPFKDRLPGNVSGVCEDHAGNLWVSVWGSGLYRLKDGKLTHYTMSDGLLHSVIYPIYEDRAGTIWIGTRGGLNQFKDGKLTGFTTKDGLSDNQVYPIYEDREGTLWIGTYGGGLNRFKNGKFTSFTTKEGLSDGRVSAIYEDREGSLWVGTEGGLHRLRDGKVTDYTTHEGLAHDWAYPIYEDRAGNLWIGTKGGLTRCKDGKMTNYTTKDGLSHNVVRAICEDRAGNLWIGTQGGGLNRFKDGTFTHYPAKHGLPSDDVRAIYEDRQGNLWVGRVDAHGNPIKLKDGRFITATGERALAHDVVFVMLEDRAGNLWFGRSDGLYRFKDGQTRHYTDQESPGRIMVMALYEDDQGSLWIGTYNRGLYRFKDGKFTAFTMAQGLADDWVYQILDDGKGNFWMSSNKGIFHVSQKELNDFADGKINSVTCVAYGRGDGMKATGCEGANQSAGCKTRDGKLWFPTTKGVVMIDPEHIPTNTLPPPVYIEQVIADENVVDLSRKVELSPGREKLEFHYTALSFLDPSKVKFKYVLEGFDKEWVDAGTRRVAYYTSIPPGPYRFRVIACNNDGVWNEAGAAVDFYLKPHFYQTHWFYALCALALVLMGVGSFRLRLSQLKAREKKLVRLVQERTKDLQEAKQQLEEINQTLEHRVAEGIKALAEAERMAAYGQMVAGVAHEVRHPIFALRTAAYVLKENFDNHEQSLAQLKTLERETQRMMDLMNDLLEFARPKALMRAPIDPGKLLEEAVQIYRAEHDPSFPNIVTATNAHLPAIVVDRSRLVQVLVNLIQNAATHARGVTTVTLSIDLVTNPSPAGEEPSQLCIRVKDDGAGIAPEHVPKIFEPFFSMGKGTGLGLAIVQRIVKEHGGTISVDSEPGRGTVFTICLPTKHTESTKRGE